MERISTKKRRLASIVVVVGVVLLALPDSVCAAAPSLVLSSVRITPGRVIVGSVFDVEMVVANVGDLTALTAALALDLTSIPNTPLSVVGSGTLLDIGQVPAGANASISASLAVGHQAATGTYDIPYVLTYSDENKYWYNSTGTFGVIVSGTPDVEIQSVMLEQSDLKQGTDSTLSVSFINIGTEDGYDITIRIYNDGGLLTSTVAYIASLARGASTTVAFGVHVDQYAAIGTRLLNITLDWRDPSGNRYLNEKAYDLRVYPSEPLIPLYDMPLIAGIVVFIVIVYVAFRRLGHRFW
jgi:hypothetical protein